MSTLQLGNNWSWDDLFHTVAVGSHGSRRRFVRRCESLGRFEHGPGLISRFPAIEDRQPAEDETVDRDIYGVEGYADGNFPPVRDLPLSQFPVEREHGGIQPVEHHADDDEDSAETDQPYQPVPDGVS